MGAGDVRGQRFQGGGPGGGVGDGEGRRKGRGGLGWLFTYRLKEGNIY